MKRILRLLAIFAFLFSLAQTEVYAKKKSRKMKKLISLLVPILLIPLGLGAQSDTIKSTYVFNLTGVVNTVNGSNRSIGQPINIGEAMRLKILTWLYCSSGVSRVGCNTGPMDTSPTIIISASLQCPGPA